MEFKEFVSLKGELKAGDNRQLKLIYAANSSYCIKNLISKYNCPKEDAEDIYVDSILNFREKLLSGKIEALTNLRSYLFATCKNMFLVRAQREKRVNRAVVELYDHNDNLVTESSFYTEDQQAEFVKITEEALLALPEKCRQLLKSYYFEELSLDEIANKFDFANSNVAKVSKSRCFSKLIEQIRIIQQKLNRE